MWERSELRTTGFLRGGPGDESPPPSPQTPLPTPCKGYMIGGFYLVPKLGLGTVMIVLKLSLGSKFRSQVQLGNENKNFRHDKEA